MRMTSVVLLLATVAASAIADMPPSATVVAKIAGDGHKLLLDGRGRVFGWGASDDGQLGPTTGEQRTATAPNPLVAIALPGPAIDIAASAGTSYALLADGTVMAWGRGDSGQIGNGAAPTRDFSRPFQNGVPSPTRVAGLADVVQISAGGNAVVALHRDGSVSAWGSREAGVIGDSRHPQRYGESGPPASTPVRVPGVSGIVQVSTSGRHVLALTGDGRVMSWGSNRQGALGRPPRRELPLDQAAEVTGLADVVAVAAGNGVSTVLKKDGSVWVWGSNWHGQFGNGERVDLPDLEPRRVPGVAQVAALSVGFTGRHTLALLKDGSLRGWGNTDWGQIGAGVAATYQASPVVPKINGVKSVFAVGNLSFAVRTDGSLWVWGLGGPGEWPLRANAKLPVKIDLLLPP